MKRIILILFAFAFLCACIDEEKKDAESDLYPHYGALSIGDLAAFNYDKSAFDESLYEIPYTFKVIET